MSKKTNYYESSPSYGLIRKEFKRFNDLELFTGKSYLFTRLNKIKIWYGSSSKAKDKKAILGIEANYRLAKENKENLNRHTCEIKASNIIVKELKLTKTDYFCKINLCFDDVLTYIKLQSRNGKSIELGDYDAKYAKNISFNSDKDSHIIQTFHGYYDNEGIRALGMRHISKSKYCLVNNIDILYLRHKIKNDEKLKQYWENEKNINKLNMGMKAVAKLAMLPDNPFSYVFKYLII